MHEVVFCCNKRRAKHIHVHPWYFSCNKYDVFVAKRGGLSTYTSVLGIFLATNVNE